MLQQVFWEHCRLYSHSNPGCYCSFLWASLGVQGSPPRNCSTGCCRWLRTKRRRKRTGAAGRRAESGQAFWWSSGERRWGWMADLEVHTLTLFLNLIYSQKPGRSLTGLNLGDFFFLPETFIMSHPSHQVRMLFDSWGNFFPNMRNYHLTININDISVLDKMFKWQPKCSAHRKWIKRTRVQSYLSYFHFNSFSFFLFFPFFFNLLCFI